jgi:hypothetical protein
MKQSTRYLQVVNMSTSKVFCVGDGFTTGHIWPEWPQMLKALLPNHNVEVISSPGAGAEYLVSELLARDIKDSTIVFQWPPALRFDKLLTDDSWDRHIIKDQVYSNNFSDGVTGRWWLSSGSKLPEVRHYHEFYVQKKQMDLRLELYKTLLDSHLHQQGCNFFYISTEEQENFYRLPRFDSVRQSHPQPVPQAHFHFLKDVILPAIGLTVDHDNMHYLEHEIATNSWIAFDPDREHIWSSIVNNIK